MPLAIYTSVFKNSSIGHISYYDKEGFEYHGQPEGSVMTVEFQIEGRDFVALNGGPHFKFNETISLVVNCENQTEIDYYWEKLGAGGDPPAQQCGWLKDKYGLSWRVTAAMLDEMIRDPDPQRRQRVLRAMFVMKSYILKPCRRCMRSVDRLIAMIVCS